MRIDPSPRNAPAGFRAIVLVLLFALLGISGNPQDGDSGTLTQRDRERWSADSRLDLSLSRMLKRGAPDADLVRSTWNPLADESSVSPADLIPVVIEGEISPGALAQAGVQIQTQAGAITTALLPVDALVDVLAQAGVRAVYAPAQLVPQLDQSMPEIEAPFLWDGSGTPPVYSGYTGKNVIIGIIDTGIDLTHKDFRTLANKTRVKFLWDQTALGSGPTGFGYGLEFTESQINSGSVTTTDDDGHGTHIAGVAASNGQATGNGYPAWRYVGAAPEADLIIVKSKLLENQIIDGSNYIFQKATALGKKAVVLIAAGTQRGAHDGSYSLDQALSALTGPGRLIVASVGNNSGQAVHASLALAANQTDNIILTIPTYTPSLAATEKFEFSGWHEPSASFNVKLTSPSGYTTGWVSPGTQSTRLRTLDGAFAIWNATRTTTKGAKEIYVYCLDDSGNIGPKVGNWRLDVQRRASTATGRVDFWLFDWLFAGFVKPLFSSHVDATMLVTSPATGDSIVGIGAYTSRKNWIGINGVQTGLMDPVTLGAIASFSSPGPRRDGVARPDVAAPGQVVAAALSAPVSARLGSSGIKVDDTVHYVLQGTSIAAAHATGGLALFLQEQPGLVPSGGRRLLISRAVADGFTGYPLPNPSWGYGKLNLSNQAVAVGDPGATRFSFAPPFPNPVRTSAVFQFTLSVEDLVGAERVQLRIVDVAGREVATLWTPAVAGSHRLTWDGLAGNGARVPTGVYFAKLEVGSRSEVRKFVRMQ